MTMNQTQLQQAVAAMSRPLDYDFMGDDEKSEWLNEARLGCLSDEVCKRKCDANRDMKLLKWKEEAIAEKDLVYAADSDWPDHIKADYWTRERPYHLESVAYFKERLAESTALYQAVSKQHEAFKLTVSKKQEQRQRQKQGKSQLKKTAPLRISVL